MSAPDPVAAGLLCAAAGVLLPGDGAWPPAGSLDLGATMVDIASRHPGSQAALTGFTAVAPTALIDPAADVDVRTAELCSLEANNPMAFAAVRAVAYEAYYAHPDVQAVLAERCGFRPGPAQPQGYRQFLELDVPPDLSGVRARGLTWRDDGTPTAAAVRAAQESHPDKQWNEEEIWLWQR